MKYTTTRLKHTIATRYRRHESAIRHALEGATFVVALVLISKLLAPPAPVPVVPVRPMGLNQPAIVIMKETAQPLPTYTPAPAPTAVVIVEQAPAQIIEVPVYIQAPPVAAPEAPQQAEEAAPVVEAAPTPAAAVYEVLTERQQNIQQHYIDIPTRAPLQDDDVTRNWAAEQWRAEHCIGGVCH